MSAAVGALVSAGVALTLTPLVLGRAPARLTRVNVNGRPVPAVLAVPLVAGSAAGILFLALAGSGADGPLIAAVAVTLLVMGAAGLWDDLRGDEKERGFRGHLGALARLSITGGLVKIGAGLVTGVIVALLIEEGVGDRLAVALVVPLGANLLNLLDRAPGRAGKVALVALALSAIAGPSGVATALGPTLAALLVVLVWDLAERGMLGDAGANPIGGIAGLGAALAVDGVARWILFGVLLGANLASERWSFSRAIERSRALAWLDMLGRRRG